MKPHQERVVAEKRELDAKRSSLSEFIRGTIFGSLSTTEQTRLRSQLAVMDDYSVILGLRIADFEPELTDADRLKWILTNCKIIYYPPDNAYPIEHDLNARKDSTATLEAEMRRDLIKPAKPDEGAAPDDIRSLAPHEIFVFGSNTRGIHGAGAAAFAKARFGALLGVGSGRTGQCYALPTKNDYLKSLPLVSIALHVEDFLDYAKYNPSLTFYVTKVGCGLAGYTPEEIAPLFAKRTPNVRLPRAFLDVLNREQKPSSED